MKNTIILRQIPFTLIKFSFTKKNATHNTKQFTINKGVRIT